MALNNIQKEILDALLQSIVETCDEFKPEERLKILKAIVSSKIDTETRHMLKDIDMLDYVYQQRAILSHPCPQNRNVGDHTAASNRENGVINGMVYYWHNGFGSRVKHEQQGLLGLTAKNDDKTAPVTKLDVVDYVRHKIYYQIYLDNFKLKKTSWDFWQAHSGAYYLSFADREIRISSPDNLTRKYDTFYAPWAEKIQISCKIKKTEDIQFIRQLIAEEKPIIKNRRVRAGNGYEDVLFSIGEAGHVSVTFYGKDPATCDLLNIINKFIFEDEMPLHVLNKLREITGQEFVHYQDNIAYEEGKGTLKQCKNTSMLSKFKSYFLKVFNYQNQKELSPQEETFRNEFFSHYNSGCLGGHWGFFKRNQFNEFNVRAYAESNHESATAEALRKMNQS